MKRFSVLLALIGVLAFLVRVATLIELRDTPFFSVLIGDAIMFDTLAREILKGNWLGTPQFYEPPLYPHVVALIYAIAGMDAFAVRVFQAALGAMTCVLVALAGKEYFDERSGLCAGALLAVYGPAVFFDTLLHKASLDAFLTAALVVALAFAADSPRRRWIVLAGLSVAALSWNRENARLLIPVIALWLGLRRRVAAVAVFLVAVALVLVPVMIRNQRASGAALLSSSQFGANFYIGNHKGATGGYDPLLPGRGNILYERQDAKMVAENAAGRTLTPSEVSDYWFHRAVGDIREAPGAWLLLLARKAWLTLAAAEPVDTESISAYAQFSRVLWILRWVDFGVVLPLAVLGAWTTRSMWRRVSVLYALFLVSVLSVVAFFVFARYRYPLVPILLPFAGAGIMTLVRARGLPRRHWASAVAFALVIAVLVHIPVRTSSDETLLNYGNELVRQGRAQEGLPLLQRAVAADPDHFEAHLDLAFAMDHLPEFEKSGAIVEQYRHAIRLRPDSALAHGGLGMALHKQGRTEEAVVEYREALRLKPDFTELQSNLALALMQAGRLSEAIDVFRRAVALQADDVVLRLNLCRALSAAQRQSEALACYRQAASRARQPHDVMRAEYENGQALAADGQVAAAIFSLDRALGAARTLGDAGAIATIEQSLQMLRRDP